MEDDILTKEEIAKLLKVTVRTVDRMRSEGMPYFKVGNAVRFRKEKVIQWLEQKGKN